MSADYFVFNHRGRYVILRLPCDDGVTHIGALIGTNHQAACAFARDLSAEWGKHVSVYRVGAHGDQMVELGRLALERDEGEDCCWFLDTYTRNPDPSRSLFESLVLRRSLFTEMEANHREK